MSEIAKCPVCGQDPEVWCRDEEIRIRIVCCKHAAYSTTGWNKYAAAMELARAYAWENEVNEMRNWMDDSCSISEPWEEIIESSVAAERELFEADDAVLEAFK